MNEPTYLVTKYEHFSARLEQILEMAAESGLDQATNLMIGPSPLWEDAVAYSEEFLTDLGLTPTPSNPKRAIRASFSSRVERERWMARRIALMVAQKSDPWEPGEARRHLTIALDWMAIMLDGLVIGVNGGETLSDR